MSASKQLRLAQKSALEQQQVIADLAMLVKSIERCEKTIVDLKTELEIINAKYQNRKSTQEDVAYLTDLLKCAHKKLAWEKQIASLQKRTPGLLEKMNLLMNDSKIPPSDDVRAAMLEALRGVQSAMERLQRVKVD